MLSLNQPRKAKESRKAKKSRKAVFMISGSKGGEQNKPCFPFSYPPDLEPNDNRSLQSSYIARSMGAKIRVLHSTIEIYKDLEYKRYMSYDCRRISIGPGL